jgi:hypothetical protein
VLPNSGSSVAAALARNSGVADLVDAHVDVAGEAGATAAHQAATVIGTALTGRDHIDDVTGAAGRATRRLFDQVRAAPTIARSVTWRAGMI